MHDCSVGKRSDDPLSPAFVPSLFAYTEPRKKRQAEEALEKYLSVKKRKERIENMRIEKEASKQQDAIVIESEPELVDQEEEENQQDAW